MRYTNDDIVPAAIRGLNAQNSTASFWTEHYRPNFTRYGAPHYGALPYRLRAILDAEFNAGNIDQVIYSYSTPIAWHDVARDEWVIPDVSYSMTTSSKHRPKLYRLRSSVAIPGDCGADDEYQAYVTRRSIYSNGGKIRAGYGV